MDAVQVWTTVFGTGPAAMVLFALWKGWLVTGAHAADLRLERDEWKALGQRQLGILNREARTAETSLQTSQISVTLLDQLRAALEAEQT